MDFKLLCCYYEEKFKDFTDLELHLKSPVHRITSKTKFFPCRTNNCKREFTNFINFKCHVITVHNLTELADTNKIILADTRI